VPNSAPEQPPEDAARPRRRKKSSRKRGPRMDDEPVRYTVSSMDEVEAAPEPEDEGIPPQRYPHDLDDGRIDPDAAKVVRRLVRSGYEAYLVGGCVRDLLLGSAVKDFDVATSARPEVVRELFRNCRIIGRRFRLAHVLYGAGKVIETATFRRNPTDLDKAGDDLLIRDDNVFGRAHEDAYRRDFTINALFYDLEAREVLDWCQGMGDIQQRSVRTIGDPMIRFKEDPVRMLRAIRFSSRLDLGIEPATYEAIVQCRGALAQAARPRLFEEVLRLMRGGAAHRSIWLAWEMGLLDLLLPELSTYLCDLDEGDDRVWRLLDQIDWLSANSKEPVDDIVMLCLLLHEPLMEACEGQRDRITAAHDFLEPLVERLAMPRRIADAMRRIVAVLPRLEQGKAPKFQKTPLAGLAEQVLQCSQAANATRVGSPFGGFGRDTEAQTPTKRRRRKR
jgi:poly(A) polymerase